jgi:radical SAM superfamily enzyme YgiQ (UPF0313 family)
MIRKESNVSNVLLVYPEHPTSFWSFDEALAMLDRQSAFPPLGLLTIAGMFPDGYALRLIDMNVKPLEDADLDWADIVVTSSMIIHWQSLEEVIARCNARDVPVLNGGPLPTQYADEIQGRAVFYLGEAENGFIDLVEEMLAAGGAGDRRTVDRRGSFRPLTETPLPRWDLVDFSRYGTMLLQITRGCPESCTFCNIPTLFGRTTRMKPASRMVREMDALYDAGWRGPVMAVDDNFVGNQEAILAALEDEVVAWQQRHGYPFQFNTQVSVRLSDNPALCHAMVEAGFEKVFVGIESPVTESLKFMGAQKNLQGDRSLLEKVRTLQGHGFEVQAGFIIGLDTDPDDIAERMIAFIQDAGIPVAMVGILGVLRDTPDYKRYQRTGRLVEHAKYRGDSGVFNRELSFVPTIPPEELFARLRTVVAAVNSPGPFYERCRTLFRAQTRLPLVPMRVRGAELAAFGRILWRLGISGTDRALFWRFLADTLLHHPRSFPRAIALAAQGHHLILTTRDALHVDEVKTFFSEALECLERYSQGSGDIFRRGMGRQAGRLMRQAQAGFRQFQDERRTLRHNAGVMLTAANESYATARDGCRRQLSEPLARFRRQIDHLLERHTGEPGGPWTLAGARR